MAQVEAIGGNLMNALLHLRRIAAWVRRHPLVLCLPVQAVLLFADLGRLPLWGDEQSSLTRAAFGIVPSRTVHPSLYFAMLRGWLLAFCGGPSVVGARALSGVFLLLATVAVDRCWVRDLQPRERLWFLVLWTLSPALLLYGRMARSYTLQLLLACLALYTGTRYARRPAALTLLPYAAAAAALLNTHYLPGIAVIAGVAAVMGWRAVAARRPAALAAALLAPLIIGLVAAPWLPRFTGAVAQVAEHNGYHLVGPVADIALALVFTLVSFSVGESLWPWMVAALPALAPLLAVLCLRGLRSAPGWLGIVGIATVIAFAGAYRWASYAFVAARLLFLLPFYLLLLASGTRGRSALGTIACSGMALLSVGGIGAYFAQSGFLNKAYLVPSETIAAAIRSGAHGEPLTVLLDHQSSDLSAVAGRLPGEAHIVYIADATSARRAIALAAEPGLRQAWFVHSTHDVSPDRWNERVTEAFAPHFALQRTQFVAYSRLDRWLMHLANWQQRPRYAIELVEMDALAATR